MANKKSNKKPAAPSKKKGISARMQWGIIIGIGVAIIGGIVFNGVRDAADDGGAGVVARESFDLPNLVNDDDPADRILLADFEGTPTVVNFFASWCTACDDELPAFRSVAAEQAGEVDFIFVNSNETGDWKPMVERHGMDDLVLAKDIQGIRRNGLYRDLGGTGGMPITAFYDAQGRLVDTSFTAFSEASLNAALLQLGLVS